jgi:type II secretory pathway component GspD/PulD (secretin)
MRIRTMSNRTLVTSLAALALIVSANAQTTEPARQPADSPAVTVAGAEPTQGAATRDRDTLSVDFPDEDIKTILRNVADLFELNLVVPDTLTGKTSIKLRDVTWRQIFQVVLSPAGYTFVEEGNIIKVVSNESLTAEPVSTEVFILNNAKAADIKPTVEGLVDAAAGGKILIDARSNALVITERPSRMTRVRVIIEQLDKATDQVMIESRFVEVTDRDIRNIGVNWASLQGMQVGVGGINQTFNRSRTQSFQNGNGATTTTTTTTGNQQEAVAVGASGTTGSTTNTATSGTTLQPLTTTVTDPVTGLVTQVTTPTTVSNNSNNSTTTTTTPTGTTTTTTTTTLGGTGVQSAVDMLTSLTNGGGTSRLASAVFSASDFNIIISALKTQNNTKIISNPTVVTLNNSEATLNIGSEFPIPSYTYNAERGTFEVSGFQYKPIGVILKVTPQVNAQGLIRLNLEPEISQQADQTTFGGAGGAQIPIISTRKVKTQVSLQDGYTAGIGGLISTSKSHGSNRVPVLGDIPGLGRLFSSKSVNDTTTNLLIFITAKTVNADGATPNAVFRPSALEAVGTDI